MESLVLKKNNLNKNDTFMTYKQFKRIYDTFFNENDTFMTFNQFKRKYVLNIDYITYFAVRSYTFKTGLIVDNNYRSNDLIETVNVNYSRQ